MHIDKLVRVFATLEPPVRDRLTDFNNHINNASQLTNDSIDLTSLYTNVEKRMRDLGCKERFSLSILFSFVLAAINLKVEIVEIERQLSKVPDVVISRIGDLKNHEFYEAVFPNINNTGEHADEITNFIWAYVIHTSDMATLSELVMGFYTSAKTDSELTENKFIKTAEKYASEFRDHPVEWIMEIS